MSKLTADGSAIQVTPGTVATIIKRTLPLVLTLHKAGRKTIIAVWMYDSSTDSFDCRLSTNLNESLREWKDGTL